MHRMVESLIIVIAQARALKTRSAEREPYKRPVGRVNLRTLRPCVLARALARRRLTSRTLREPDGIVLDLAAALRL
jgi:hypothetical protein